MPTEFEIKTDEELAERNTARTRKLLAITSEMASNPMEEAALLLSAATVVLDRAVGPELTGPFLLTLLEPTFGSSRPGATAH